MTLPKSLCTLVCLLLAGCVYLPESAPPPERYTLEPPAFDPSEQLPTEAAFRVGEVLLPARLASDRIAVLREGGRVDHLANVRWSASLSDLLQDYLADGVEARWGATAWGRTPARYRIVAAIRDLQAEYPNGSNEPPKLRVHLIATLMEASSGEVVARVSEHHVREAESNRVGVIVEGLEGLLGTALSGMLDRFETGVEEQGKGGASPTTRSG